MSTPTPERWRQIEQLLDAIIELSPEDRSAYLGHACAGDESLRVEVETLLRACDSAEHFLEKPAAIVTSIVDQLVAAGEGPDITTLAPGTRIGAYRIVREAGRGGMGIVYLAERNDGEFHKRVALKLVARRAVAQEDGFRRFREERQILASLEHPSITRLLDGGVTTDGLPYYVMEYVEGTPIGIHCDEQRLSVAARLELFCRVCDAVQYAHENGIVHRDLKPSNILVTARGEVRLLDFGIAKVLSADSAGVPASPTRLTEPGLRIMTPDYASPEQVRGDAASAASDVYSLGVLLYSLLGGRHPHRRAGDSWDSVERRILHEPVLPPSEMVLRSVVPSSTDEDESLAPTDAAATRQTTPEGLHRALRGDLDAIVLQAMSKEPEKRYATAGAFATDVRRHLAGDPVHARSAHLADRVRTRTRRPRVAAISAVIAVVTAAAVGAAAFASSASRASASRATEAPPARRAAAAIAILRFVPTANDSALDRLGHDLAGTLSATLNGVSDLRVIDAPMVIARTSGRDASTPAELRATAHDLGATVVVTGSLARAGDRVRADATLLSYDSAATSTSVSIEAALADLAVVTDSLTFALTRALWRTRGAPIPSPAAVTTHSLSALRAYVEGEQFVRQYRPRAAAEAFARAIAADSMFWYAYWRYAFSQELGAVRVDTAVAARYMEHRSQFPEPDRLLIEVWSARHLTDRLKGARALVLRFPGYVPGWFALGEISLRQGPFAGVALEHASYALLRCVSLQPDFVPAWDRLAWIALAERDTVAARRALAALGRLHYDSTSALDGAPDMMLLYRSLDRLARDRGKFESTIGDSLAAATGGSLEQRPDPRGRFGVPDRLQGGIVRFGFHAARIALAERSLEAHPPTATAASFEWRVIANGWASRGAWDRALAAADTAVSTDPKPFVALFAYRLAVLGAWLQAVDPAAATARRDRVAHGAEAMTRADHAELAWVDGLFAATRRDTAALRRARTAVQAADARGATLLDSSLASLQLDLAGDRAHARRILVALERDRYYLDNNHPYLTGVDRLTASRWLAEAGDTAEAARLLMWHEAFLYPAPQTAHANALLAAFAYLEGGRMMDSLGQQSAARKAYEQFLTRYDAPVARHQPLVDDVTRRLARMRP